jgi:hypothetical protein
MARKGFNISSNICYNRITFCPHAFERGVFRRLSLDNIEETVRSGTIYAKRSRFPRVCIRRYFGKENFTYFVIVQCHVDYCEVITAWKRKGN